MAGIHQQNPFLIHSHQLQGASNPSAGAYEGLTCDSDGVNSNGYTDNEIESEKERDHEYTDSGRAETTSTLAMHDLRVIDLDDEVLYANPRFSPKSRFVPSAGIRVESTRKSGSWMGAWQIVTAMIMVAVIYGVALATWLCAVGGEGAPLALQSNLNSWKSRVVYHVRSTVGIQQQLVGMSFLKDNMQ